LLSVLGAAPGRTRYLARRRDFYALVSIEIVDRSALAGLSLEDLRRRFSQLLAFRHASIARVADAWVDGAGDACVVSEYVPGHSIGHCAALDQDEVLRAFDAVCAALDDAHGQGIVHGRLEPDSVVLLPSGTGVLPRLTGLSVYAGETSVADDVAGLGRVLRAMTAGHRFAAVAAEIARRAEGAGGAPFDSIKALREAAGTLRLPVVPAPPGIGT
jgi:hypothetical protein